MKLPMLPDLDFDVPAESEKTVSEKKTKAPAKSKKKKERKSIIPKTSYDDEGNPTLAIPDLDDVDLNSEINRFFGKGGG